MIRNLAPALATAMLLTLAPHAVAAPPDSERSAAQLRKEVSEAAEAIRRYTAEQRDEALEKAKSALGAVDSQLASLEGYVDRNWDTMSDAARARARAALRELREQRVEVAEWYGSLKSSAPELWDHAKKGFSDAYAALRGAWHKAEKELEAPKGR